MIEERVAMTWDMLSYGAQAQSPQIIQRGFTKGEKVQAGQRAARSELDWLYILPGNSSRAVYGESAQREALDRDVP